MTTVISCEAVIARRARSIEARQPAMRASGEFAGIGTTPETVGARLCEAVDLRGGERVLDVAAGHGSMMLAAAERFAAVTSTDYVRELLDRERLRAHAEGLTITFTPADAESLPYGDRTFDVVLSSFGAMFAPNHDAVAREVMRVCRPGGRIGLASWTPDGFMGQLFRVVAAYLPPIPRVKSPLLWGSETHLRTLFAGVESASHTEREFSFRSRSPQQLVQVLCAWYLPMCHAFGSLDDVRHTALEADLIELIERNDRGGGNGLVVPAAYLETVIVR